MKISLLTSLVYISRSFGAYPTVSGFWRVEVLAVWLPRVDRWRGYASDVVTESFRKELAAVWPATER